jgi:A/G-specific adenine glycosylase
MSADASAAQQRRSARASGDSGAPAALLSPTLVREFARRLLAWHPMHGRSDLPWQGSRDPYRVWLSEIMLQQTQVVTVVGYFHRFVDRFPTVQHLAAAPLDEVLGLWSGLGYYSRARNLHRCAVEVVERFGQFPPTAEQLQSLPGIGPSTAAAIASFCFSERAAILDGNVKRVLARVLAFEADVGAGSCQRQLLAHAQQLLPTADRMPVYSQAIMDLGATVCLPRQPRCDVCPLASLCKARSQEQVTHYPVKSRKIKRSSLRLWLLWAVRGDGAVWLARRPESGIWGGLYCLPVYESSQALLQGLPERLRHSVQEQPAFMHALTHRDLHLHPVRLTVDARRDRLAQGQWFKPSELPDLGLPAPVRKLLTS